MKTMVREISWVAGAVVGLGLLAGCKMDSVTEVYVTDVEDALHSGEVLNANVDLRIEMPSEDHCRQNAADVEQLLGAHLPEFEATNCVQDGFQAYMEGSARIPMLNPERVEQDFDTSLLVLVLSESEAASGSDNPVIRLSVYLDGQRFQQLNREVSQRFYQDIDLAGSRVELRVHNDDRRDWLVAVNSAFMDGEPVLSGAKQLSRRDRTQIRLSDVARSYLVEEGMVPAAQMQAVTE